MTTTDRLVALSEQVADRGGTRREVGILGVGRAVPDRVLTNHDLEQMVDTSDEWIRSRTGIVERRIVPPEVACSDLATEASWKALESAGLGPDDIDAVIVGTVTPDTPFPSTACRVQARLGLHHVPSFDISAACPGFLYGMVLARSLVHSGEARHVLVVGAEILSKIVNWKDRSTCVLFGDGAGAVIVGVPRGKSGLLAWTWGADGSLAHLLEQPAGGSRMPASHETVEKNLHTLHMNGNEVFRHAVRAMQEAVLEVIEKAGIHPGEIDLFIPHQANTRIMEATARRAGIPLDKVYVTIQRYGNNSAASIPVAMADAVAEGRLRPGNLLLVATFGAGFTWGAAIVRW